MSFARTLACALRKSESGRRPNYSTKICTFGCAFLALLADFSERYTEERNKRLRSDGLGQFVKPADSTQFKSGFGGTWYWNRYPGLMCDIESYATPRGNRVQIL
ncbi:hypothetical protein K438DRAFT_1954946 [Mycena galopus ATCC 62051]|nr:hypothetical protein K438DRAFT_1954946 [Mycena galopus ATCC 62051]